MKFGLPSAPRAKWLLLLGGALLVLFSGRSLVTIAFSDLCGNDVLIETFSPNGKLKAVSFRRSCGATSGFSTHVSILPAATRLPNDAGNTFIADDDPPIVTRWLDDHRLLISASSGQMTILKESSVRGVQIVHE